MKHNDWRNIATALLFGVGLAFVASDGEDMFMLTVSKLIGLSLIFASLRIGLRRSKKNA